MSILSFFLQTKLGRWLAVGAVIAAPVALLAFRIFAAGKATVKTTILKNTLNLALERIRHDQNIGRLSADDLRKRLRERFSIED